MIIIANQSNKELQAMASDRKQFMRAEKKWHELKRANCFSVPANVGKVAIFCSYLTDLGGETAEQQKHLDEIAVFKKEAEALHEFTTLRGRMSEVILDGKGDDLATILKDPSFSSVITIGHGALSYLYVPNGTREVLAPMQDDAQTFTVTEVPNNRFDWRDASRASNHLKLGGFVQRQCGHAVRRLSVPLGAFSVADYSQVVAATNMTFTPESLTDIQNDNLVSITNDFNVDYESLTELYEEYLHISSDDDEPEMANQ